MRVIGLTGGIASGKSTVSSMLKELGADIIDVDVVGRMVVGRGQKAYKRIVEEFGEEMLLPNGDIDRRKLGGVVFSNSAQLKLLNHITHPEILTMVKEQIDAFRQKGSVAVVIDAAILIEMGLNELVDEVWLVMVNKDTQIKRLMERERFAYSDAVNRINSQFTNEQKMRYADIVIDNNKQISEVKEAINSLWAKTISRGE